MSSPSITTPAPAYEVRTVTQTTTGLELFGDDKTVVAVRVNGVIQDLHLAIRPFDRLRERGGRAGCSIESDEGLAILRHSAAHVLAQAVQAGRPGTSSASARRSPTASTTTSMWPEPFIPDVVGTSRRR